MCEPVSISAAIGTALSAAGSAAATAATASTLGYVTAGISAASTILGFVGQQQQSAQAKQAANRNYNARVEQMSRENAQLSEQRSSESLSDAVALAEAQGRIANRASASGTGNYSAHRAFAANAAGYNRALGIKDTNTANARQNLQTNIEGANLERESEIAANPSPSFASLALGLGKAGLEGVNTYTSLGGKFGIKPASKAIPL